MPANLTPDYKAAEERFKQARTPAEKTACLKEMLATIPKHKGTEKLQADIKRRLAKLREEGQKSKKKKGGPADDYYHVEREGAGQVALAGPPNVGKSALVAHLTAAEVEVADYPFTTVYPQPGMMPFEDIQIQLVDTPPLTPDFYEPWLPQILKGADALLLVVDLSAEDLLEQVEVIPVVLERMGIAPVSRDQGSGIREIVTLRTPDTVPHRALWIGTKSDRPGALDNLEILRELAGPCSLDLAVSTVTGAGLDEFKRRAFALLEVVRVYTKVPGKPPDLTRPFVMPRGATVLDVTRIIHKELAETLKYARIWGTGKYEGQMVDRRYVLQDKDVLEIHA